MPISVRPVAALDLATLERCSTVELAAFASDFHSLAFPGPFPEDRAETKAQALSTTIQNDGCRVFAAWAVDDEGSETLVGCARWFVYRKSMPEPELHSFGPGVHVAAATEMLGAIDGLRKANSSGKPCVCEFSWQLGGLFGVGGGQGSEEKVSVLGNYSAGQDGAWN
ncbi:hypothetical protein VDGD_03480 [Verticillium dahliae]|uniref:N-acetyltransferase domain-containing protein n=1 Tax=Verticillium dahliae (strain VdLs.17 / ATCC MYA-4575 / FGSC 10137) TaxID=498257 RepID=G2WZN8_VERDV|nr:uncharacterized protein VDAG_03480 [Verticillium dahliae VdLs.17]EGY22040.1 hypothetical protein VDAG_03480 [Verticillium dahliae VdLs.17]RBQ94966.1 hypothetical protein VDGD_03480 [Verticillium dahliae]